jgi:hypothetical protein
MGLRGTESLHQLRHASTTFDIQPSRALEPCLIWFSLRPATEQAAGRLGSAGQGMTPLPPRGDHFSGKRLFLRVKYIASPQIAWSMLCSFPCGLLLLLPVSRRCFIPSYSLFYCQTVSTKQQHRSRSRRDDHVELHARRRKGPRGW